MAGRTQEALYAEIDLELSWSEEAAAAGRADEARPRAAPVPRQVRAAARRGRSSRRYFAPGDRVYDPFAGSGTTLVEANAFGADAIGCDISAFNCLLAEVKTARYSLGELELGLRGALEEARRDPARPAGATPWLEQWYAPRALGELLAYRAAVASAAGAAARRRAASCSSRAARSARRTTHFDLDFPAAPATEPYWCLKHKRTCRPTEEAREVPRPLHERHDPPDPRVRRACGPSARVTVLHDDARTVRLPARPDGVFTSPPYPGLIDYHEQHRYAYELLGLDDRRDEEIGAAAAGRGRAAVERYVEAMSAAFANTRRAARAGRPRADRRQRLEGALPARSSTRPGSSSRSGSRATSTGARAAAPASTSRTS